MIEIVNWKRGMEVKNEMQLEFRAISDNEAFARTAVAAFVAQLNPTLEEISDIKTAVSEAVTNSIIHGYEGEDCEENRVWIHCFIKEDVLEAQNIPYKEVERLEDALSQLDILYMTRVQKERFFNEEDYIRMKDFYILDSKKMELAPKDMYVLHPLPRVNEISVEVDDDPRAVYFKQAQYGVYVRMALILTLLEINV